jgi:CBS domain-containing protein/sporulation protein YlmC with PRC-barrel domain
MFIYISEILGIPVIDAGTNRKIGRILDFAASTTQIYPKFSAIITTMHGSKNPIYIPWSTVRQIVPRREIVIETMPDTLSGAIQGGENEILLKKTFLDKQVISTSGYKVVRVNDLQLLIDTTVKENPNLLVVHLDIGIKGLYRRLRWDKILNSMFRWLFSRDIRDKFVTWKYVQPTTTTSVRGGLRLKVDPSKFAEAHPADLADIIEDLGTEERLSLLGALDFATAAAALQEIEMRIRVQIAETIETPLLAKIINEMEMDEAVDLLDEISPDIRTAVYAALPAEQVSELKELSRLSEYSVGSIMNTNFIFARENQTTGEVMTIVQAESKQAELLYYVYVVDVEERLKGIVTLRQLLSEKPDTIIADIMTENPISVEIDTNIKRVAQIFFKYDFLAVPVVDEERRIQGIISSRDAMESVFPEIEKVAGA